ncbi:MAG: PilZ domain-containing protein [Acidobacteria bacterium]|nr:PilZ domain-containing protein [Acidobacteriota bacterium]
MKLERETVIAERRMQRRYALELPVDVSAAGAGVEGQQRAQTRDLSGAGAYLIAAADSLTEGTRVALTVWLPVGMEGEPVILRGVGRVVRVVPQEEGRVGVAVEFDVIDFGEGDTETFT